MFCLPRASALSVQCHHQEHYPAAPQKDRRRIGNSKRSAVSSGPLNNAACQLIRKTSGFTPGHVSLCVFVCVAESSNGAVDVAWDSSLNDTLEKEVQDTRKMVSALQVPEFLRSLCFNPHNAEVELICGLVLWNLIFLNQHVRFFNFMLIHPHYMHQTMVQMVQSTKWVTC